MFQRDIGVVVRPDDSINISRQRYKQTGVRQFLDRPFHHLSDLDVIYLKVFLFED